MGSSNMVMDAGILERVRMARYDKLTGCTGFEVNLLKSSKKRSFKNRSDRYSSGKKSVYTVFTNKKNRTGYVYRTATISTD